MKILDRPRKLRDDRIRLPVYHRAHLSLRLRTVVYLTVPPGNAATSPEIVGTAIHPASWPHLLCVRMTIRDRSGGVDTVLQSISTHGGHLLYLDTASVEQETLHDLEAVVDFRFLFTELQNQRHPREQTLLISDLPTIVRGMLLADCSALVGWANSRPTIRVDLVTRLVNLSANLERYGETSNLVQRTQVQKGGWLLLPPGTAQRLQQELEPTHGPNTALDSLWYTVISDTTERVFHVHFSRPDQQVLWCAIRHRSTSGATAAITSPLASAGINILTSLSRVEADREVSVLELLLSASDWSRANSLQPFRRIKHILAPHLATIRGVLFFSPTRADRESDRPGIQEESRASRLPSLRCIDVADWLAARHMDIQNLETNIPSLGAAEELSEQLEALRLGTRYVREITGRSVPKVFLSISFVRQNRRLVQAFREECAQQNWHCDVVLDTQQHPKIRREIFYRIRDASHFVGVWTRAGQRPAAPSPWCLWELGIADALGKPAYVLLEEGVEKVDFRALRPDEFYYSFEARDLSDFRRATATVLRSLARHSPIVPVFVPGPTDTFDYDETDDPC